jgi:hypothetical protein
MALPANDSGRYVHAGLVMPTAELIPAENQKPFFIGYNARSITHYPIFSLQRFFILRKMQ